MPNGGHGITPEGRTEGTPALFEARYHVPRSQVWEGSRGRQSGNVHLHLTAPLDYGRIHRNAGETLCRKRRGWYERPAEGEHLCGRCEELRDRIAEGELSVCPKCGGYVEELDGFGVLAHDRCGYCSCPSIDGDTCSICGKTYA